MPIATAHPGTVAGTDWTFDLVSLVASVQAQDVNYAKNVTNPNSNEKLICSNFGFAISGTDTIDGIIVTTNGVRLGAGPDGYDLFVQLTQDAATGTGNTLDDSKTGTLDEDFFWGNSTYKWGLTLAPADVNAVNFGCIFWGNALGVNRDLKVDEIEMTIYSSSAGGGGAVTMLASKLRRIPDIGAIRTRQPGIRRS